MKTLKKFLKSTFPVVLLAALLFAAGCQKEDLNQLTEPAAEQTSALTLEKLILEINFRVPTEGLSDEEINQRYDELMAVLSTEDRDALITIVQQAMARQEALPASSPEVSLRSGQTLLTNGIPDDGFGQGVDLAGGKVYVGASGEQKVYEYTRSRNGYTVANEVVPTGASDDFGYHVSVSGPWMAVSAPDFGTPFGRPGQVFLFQKIGTDWVQHSILNGPAGNVNFGGDGLVLKGYTLAVVSRATGFPSPGGSIHVYQLIGDTWTETGTIHRPGYDWFGIDMDDSGKRIVGTGAVNNSLGIVRASIFVNRRGAGWTLEDEVIVPSPVPFAIAFPRDVAIHNDVVVLTAFVPGSKHWVLTRNGSDWSVAQELLLTGGLPFSNRFTEIQDQKIVIGADSNNNFVSDAVYVFTQSGGSWNLSETLTPSDGGVDARLWSVALDGNTVVAGLSGTGFPPPAAPGKAYVFE